MPTVFITGASRGLGLEFARQYCTDDWRVIATCRDPAKAETLSAFGGGLRIEALDVDDGASIASLAEKLKGESIDVLINNAGIFGPKDLTRDNVDYDAWGRVFRTNVMGPLAVSSALLSNVENSEGKSIATVTSRMGSIGDTTEGEEYIYRSSKAAVNMVMTCLANELGGDGVKVVLLHPGWVKTDMGGPDAAIDAKESVTGMRAVIAGLKENDSGGFLNYDGTEIPW